MKHYGANIQVTEGSSIKNLTAPSGTAFPDNANVSELFYRTDMGKLFVCTFEGSPVTWLEATPTIINDIGDIANVNLTGSPALTINDVLTWNGSEWVHNTSTLEGLSDLSITSPAQGQFLQYDFITGKWENGIPGAGSVGSHAFAKLTAGSATFGDSVSGANLLPSSIDNNTGTPLTGTWECLGEAGSPSYTTMWIRTS